MQKTRLLLSVVSLFSITLPIHAIELNNDLNLAITVTPITDYRVGGLSLTSGNPALFVDTMLTHSSGAFIGYFATNVDFGLKTRRESDYYIGISRPLTEDVRGSIMYIDYEYPKSSIVNYSEWVGNLSAYGATLWVKYANNIKPHGDDRLVAALDYVYPLPYDVTFETHYGITDSKDDVYISRDGSSRSTYYDWMVGFSKQIWGMTWRASYVDTDLSKTECAGIMGDDSVCSATVVASVSKTF
ncbi:TorF family putative porin [Pseudomonas sp. App30]|uniref:TorF family putative porin n=1 Tax=Pseudomonas sp. App30 TaxID=3068990 RepID=UPI003A80B4FD